MIDKKTIATAARKIMRHQRGLQDPKLMHPEREWVIGLAVGLAICATAASGSAYSYFTNKHLTAEVVEATEVETVYRDAMVKDALKDFSERNREREALLANTTYVPPVVEEAATSTASSSPENLTEESAATSSESQ